MDCDQINDLQTNINSLDGKINYYENEYNTLVNQWNNYNTSTDTDVPKPNVQNLLDHMNQSITETNEIITSNTGSLSCRLNFINGIDDVLQSSLKNSEELKKQNNPASQRLIEGSKIFKLIRNIIFFQLLVLLIWSYFYFIKVNPNSTNYNPKKNILVFFGIWIIFLGIYFLINLLSVNKPKIQKINNSFSI
jgi:hypothetical protein